MTKSKAHKFILPAGIGLGCTWFSSHCGSGFATGKSFMQYFGQFGWTSVWTPVVAFAIIGVATYIMLEFCRHIKAQHYKDFAAEFYTPNIPVTRRIFILFWDFLGVSGALIGAGATFAAIGELVSQYLNLPYFVGVGIGVLLIILVTVFGAKVMIRFATTLSVCLIILILAVSIAGLANGSGDLGKVLGERMVGEGYSFWDAYIAPGPVYAAVQMSNVNYLIALSGTLITKKDVKTTAVFGAALNVVMMLCLGLMVLSYFPALNNESMPVVTALSYVNQPILTVLYQLMLFFALVTTGATIVTNVVSRFCVFGAQYVPSEPLRRAILTVVLVALGIWLSSFGFSAVLVTGYNFLGSLAGPVILLPILILGPYRLYQIKKREAGSTVAASEPATPS